MIQKAVATEGDNDAFVHERYLLYLFPQTLPLLFPARAPPEKIKRSVSALSDNTKTLHLAYELMVTSTSTVVEESEHRMSE